MIVKATTPVRVCDLGGWTDTWFARTGCVLNLAVEPRVEVSVRLFPRPEDGPRVIVHAENFGERFEPGEGLRHPILEAAIRMHPVPEHLGAELAVHSQVPPGASAGTSAAVLVALVGALDALTPGRLSAHEVAMAAHRVEVEALGKQSGVQDQLASAFGGASFIEILQYPHAARSPAEVSPRLLWEIESRLVVLFLGRAHDSSKMHEAVIAELTQEGGDAGPLDDLRRVAREGRDALARGDLDAFGQAMDENTEAQMRLHPGLVSADAHTAIAIARQLGAVGVKVNGAGGEGGSLTILCGPDPAARRATVRALEEAHPLFQVLPVRLSAEGLRRWTFPFQG